MAKSKFWRRVMPFVWAIVIFKIIEVILALLGLLIWSLLK